MIAATLLLAVTAGGAVLLFRAAMHEKAQSSGSNTLAIWLNREVLMHSSYDQPIQVYGSRFCRIEELPKIPSGKLLGHCHLFMSSDLERDCWFWWLGRTCLGLATTTELYSSDVVRESFTTLVPRLCEAGDSLVRDSLCGSVLFDTPVVLNVYTISEDRTIWDLEIEAAERVRL